MPLERLQKILSRAGISSRRQAESLILAAKVSVNGVVVSTLGAKADPERDKIEVNGKRLSFSPRYHYYAYYKPRGLIVSKRDDWGNRTVFDELKLPSAVNAVGRLDQDSEGLLLLSDDGEFLQRYTHPSFQISKVYHVQVTRALSEAEKVKFLKGIALEEKVVRAEKIKTFTNDGMLWIEIELKEGVKREIRRMLSSLAIQVKRLIRVRHGSVTLDGLSPGDCIQLKRKPD